MGRWCNGNIVVSNSAASSSILLRLNLLFGLLTCKGTVARDFLYGPTLWPASRDHTHNSTLQQWGVGVMATSWFPTPRLAVRFCYAPTCIFGQGLADLQYAARGVRVESSRLTQRVDVPHVAYIRKSQAQRQG